jgi:KDO2-lipid IV(A) lauroyltransferase
MRRNILRNQLVLCQGDRNRAHRNSRAVFTAIARHYVDVASIGRRDPASLERDTISFEHEERLEVLDSGRPVIALSAHMGSPELGVQAFIGRGRPFVALVEALTPDWFGAELNTLRAAAGGTYLTADGRGVRACLRELKAGGVVALVADRDIQGNGLCVDLCGRRVLLPAGPFELAQRTDAMIVPVLTTRESGHRLLLHVEEPFAIGLEDGAVRAGVERWAGILERYLHRYPEQWTVAEDFWQVHRCG